MSEEINSALSKLETLLKNQTELAIEQAGANRLKEEELRLKSIEADNERRRIDLEAQDLALKRETLNRAE